MRTYSDTLEAPAAATIPPGPNAGRVWRDVPNTSQDPISGCIITQITNYRGHSHHLTGPAPCWLDNGRRLVFASDREGFGNLFVYDFARAQLTQLTDLRGTDRPVGTQVLPGSRLAFLYGSALFELELTTLRILRRATVAAVGAAPSVSATRNASAGDVLLTDGRRAVWVAGNPANERDRRVVAVVAAGCQAAFITTIPCGRPHSMDVVFASDVDGYAQIFVATIDRFAALPRLDALVRVMGGASAHRPTLPRA